MKKMIKPTIILGILAISIYTAYNNPFINRYRGFQNLIDTAHISPIFVKPHGEIFNITSPKEDRLSFDYNQYLKDVRFVNLETNSKSKFSVIDKILLTENRIIIVDFNSAKGVYIFNDKGKFINSIRPNKNFTDYRSVLTDFYDVAYDYNLDEIILHNQNQNKTYHFDANGNFKNSSKEYIYFAHFVNLRNSKYFIYLNSFGGNEHIPKLAGSPLSIGLRDTKILRTVNGIHDVKTNVNYEINHNSSLSNSNNTLFYTPDFSDTVYQISGNPISVYPKLVIHYSGPNLNASLKQQKKEDINSFVRLTNTKKYYSFQGEVMSANDSIYFIESYKKDQSGYFYSTKTNNLIGGNLGSTYSGSNPVQLGCFRYPITTFNSEFVSVLPRADLEKSNYILSPKFNVVLKNAKSTDNPTLVFYKIKEF